MHYGRVIKWINKAFIELSWIFWEEWRIEWNECKSILNEFELIHNKLITSDSQVYAFSDGQRRTISNELVISYPECLLTVNMIEIDSRNINNDIKIDYSLKYLYEMVK